MHDDHVTCVHPGWPVLRGWARVAASWAAMFGGPQRLQFILTDEQARVVGDVGWVTVDENIIDGDRLDGDGSGTVTAVNIFVRSPSGWRLVAHHGSVVASR